MRGAWIVLVVAACAPHFDKRAHLGADGELWGARMLHFHEGEAGARGVVTARGGDSVDWVAFDVPELGCDRQELDISLRWKAPRGRSKLALTVYDQTRTLSVQARRRGERADAQLVSVPAGHYFARISAPGRDDAATYVLHIQQGLGMNCDMPTLPLAVFVRPVSAQRPSFPPRMDRVIVDVESFEIDQVRNNGAAALAPATGLADGEHGVLLDPHGAAIAHGGFRVFTTGTGAVAGLEEPERMLAALQRGAEPWTASITLPPPPVDAALVSVTPDYDGNVMLRFDRGSADGVLTGFVGELVHASGVRVPGARFVIVGAGQHESVGIGSFVITDPDHLRAVIGPPSRPRGTP